MASKKLNTTDDVIAKFMAMVGVDDQDKAPAVLEQALGAFLAQKRALESMGIVSMVVVERGIFQLQITPNLTDTSTGIDALDAAVADLQKTAIAFRKKLMERELARTRQELAKVESPSS